MGNNNKKSEQIVKSIKLLESVSKTTTDQKRKTRVTEEISRLRTMLKKMYPDSKLKDIEDSILSNIMAHSQEPENSITNYECLNDIEILKISNFKDDWEINEAGSIILFFEKKIWVVISDQHTKLDFSSSSERDSLNRKLDECNRAYKTFCQTIEDIEKISETIIKTGKGNHDTIQTT